SVPTLANAMDVGAPSNVERLLAWYPDPRAPEARLAAESVSDDEIRARIRATWREHGVAVCPHTACGLEVLSRLRARGAREDWLVAATAQAAKFETIVEPLIGRAIEPPPALARILARPSHAEPMAADDAALARVLG